MTQLIAEKLEGYLYALADIKDDGTLFSFTYIGDVGDESLFFQLEKRFAQCREKWVGDGPGSRDVPVPIKNWIANSIRLGEPLESLGQRMYEAFLEELFDVLGERPNWYGLILKEYVHTPGRHGAISDHFVIESSRARYLLRCSWDS